MAVSDWSETASSNTSVGGININEGCAPGNLNNAIREVMAQIRSWYATITETGASLMSASDAASARSAITAARSGDNTDITSLQSSCTATTQTLGDNSTKIATTAYADGIGARAIGWGQSWQDMAASRDIVTTYTNDTGKPITVSICANVSSNTFLILRCNGVIVDQNFAHVSGTAYTVGGIIPNGATYGLNNASSLVSWSELR